jgi:DNA-binding NtrC family response regulator
MTGATPTALIVEDDPKIRANLLFQLREEGFRASAVESAEAALGRLGAAEDGTDLLLVDVRLPGASGVDLVRRLAERDCLPPTIIISGEASITETVEALQLGVHDFIEKPFSKERLARSIHNLMEHTALRRQVAELESELGRQNEILGDSEAIRRLRALVAQVAPTDARVLIRGESGTGKELVADALHRGSPRRERPFIKINCAAIPTQLIEDELFGHVKGAFTDARSDKRGLFEEADGGTLFLDEIGDMDYQLQSRLLRVLEDSRVRRVGGAHEREVDVRVIAATHDDLEKSIEEKRFREDLYFRLCHLPIDVPPLRERGEDVRLLFEHFVDHFARRHRTRARRVDSRVFAPLESYRWPGNVRELRSLCERLVVLGADPITVDQIPGRYLRKDKALSSGDEGELLRLTAGHAIVGLREFKSRCEKLYIESVLERTGWNVTAAARLLGMQRTYLHQKIAALGSHRPGSPEPGAGRREGKIDDEA